MKSIFAIICCVLLLSGVNAEVSIPISVQKNSLLPKSWSVYSQFGEEGILEEILARLHIDKGFFAEFGAWDGIHLSNTRFLAERGWSGAFIEADDKLIEQAKENCKGLDIQCISEFVSWNSSLSQGKTFDQIADEYFPDKEIDVLSIDIDGADYLILEGLKRRPKVIVIEGGISWHPLVTRRIPDLAAKNQLNQPLAVIFEIAKKQGYKPVCFTINSFLVREDLFDAFKEIQNDPVTLWFDSWYYLQEKFPMVASYVRSTRETDRWIHQFDKYQLP